MKGARAVQERWGSRLGVILAVAGSAVGLGNFLRFPGKAAEWGGGAFMLAYFVSLLVIGLPICWAEWTMGRYAGQRGYHSCPGILFCITGRGAAKYFGVIGVVIPVIIYMYYVYIEAWCLGYAVNFAMGAMSFRSVAEAGAHFSAFVGAGGDGSAVGFRADQVGIYLVLVFVLNFVLIYRGLAKGIEWCCKYAMPALIVIGLVVLVRVLTLGAPDAAKPHHSVDNGLGFMWNPTKVVLEERGADGAWARREELVGRSAIDAARAEAGSGESLRVREISPWESLWKPELWLTAAGQIFFSLSVGFGIILTYSSYLKRDDDVVLSGLAATSANEFCEVALGGLITVPAAVAFLGVAEVAGKGTFGLGFHVLPMVFCEMPWGPGFGFLFFLLLFLAALTSSISMLQPGIAFLEEALSIGRRASVSLLGFVTAVGSGFVVYFSKGMKALDTLDFWVGTFLIFVLATVQIMMFAWGFGVERGLAEAHRGSCLRIPRFFVPVMRYVCPLFLLAIFVMWLAIDVFGIHRVGAAPEMSGYIRDLFAAPVNPVAWMSVGLIAMVGGMVWLIVLASRAYRDPDREGGGK